MSRKLRDVLLIILYGLIGVSFNIVLLNICIRKYIFVNMIARIIITLIICVGMYLLLGKINDFLNRHYVKILIVFLSVMLVAQIVFGYFLEIVPNWDFMYVFNGAIKWAETGSFADYNRYYYMYPNNIGPMMFYMVFFKLVKLVGITNYQMVATIINAVLNVGMMLVVFLICKKLWSVKSGIFSLFIFMINLPSYFGAAVFYTDVLTMIFPVLFFYLYLRLKEAKTNKSKLILMVLMGLVLFLGMKLKFTVIIVAIAIFVDMVLNGMFKKLIAMGVTVGIIYLVGALIFSSVIYPSHLDKSIAEEKNFPALHWIVMSMKGDGGFDQNDENFTNSFDTPEHRDEALRIRLRNRIEVLGVSGFRELMITKSVKCFGDGTYELNAFFSHGMKRNTFLNDYIVGDGKYYKDYEQFCSGIFLAFILLMVVGNFISVYEIISRTYSVCDKFVPYLAVFGLLLFLLMWETSPRYITNYIPMIYICAVAAMSKVDDILAARGLDVDKAGKKDKSVMVE